MKIYRKLGTVGRWFAVALLVGLASPVFAQGKPTEANMAQLDIGDGRVRFDVRGRALRDVVDLIRNKTRVDIVVDKDAEEVPITLKVTDQHWLVALELVSERGECILERRSPTLIYVSRPERVTFSFKNEDIKNVINVIATYSGANIVVSPAVNGSVTTSLKNIPWRDALEQIVKTLGYAVVEEDRGILRIIPVEDLKQQLETRVIRLKYIRPPAPYRAYLASEYTKEQIKAPNSTNPEKEFPILGALQTAVEVEGGTIEYDRVTNSVIARGTKPALDNLINLVQQIDIEPAQIFFDIKLITTRNQDLLDVGVDPGENGWTISSSMGATPSRLPFGVWSELDGLHPSGDPLATTPPDTTYGTLDFTGVSLTLRLFAQDSESQLVQAPKLVALDNQEATIFVGETVRYAETSSASNQSGGLTFSIQEAPNSPVQQGFQLLVIPHVIPGTDKVMMTVIPEAEQLSGTSTTLEGFDEFTSGQGANQVSILLPRVSASTIVTHMIVSSGETAVLGGLLTKTTTEVERGLPGIRKIPVLKWLFTVKERNETMQNLIVFMTPRVIQSSDDIDASIKDSMRDYRNRLKKDWNDIFPEDILPKDFREMGEDQVDEMADEAEKAEK
ncbi:MAG: secretin N-terminal domain-containing protein [Planctomycetota bacterium]|jgi:type IV pilus assembly protein PilQ